MAIPFGRKSERGYDLYGVRIPAHDEGYADERAQAALRTIVASLFHVNRRLWNTVALCRQRIELEDQDSCVCDICILPSDAPVERVVTIPPMVCIDVISDEPMPVVQQRVDRYERLGAKNIWLLEPLYRTAWRASESGLFQVRNDLLSVPGSPIQVAPSEVFDELDETLAQRRMSLSSALHRVRTQD